jgi:hypothetical protein
MITALVHQIFRFALATGTYLGTFGSEEDLDCPEGIAFGPGDGLLYVASFLSDSIVRYRAETGELVDTFVAQSPALDGPEHIAFSPDGAALLVASHFADQVVAFDALSGQPLGVLAAVERPVGLAVWRGHVFATSYTGNVVLRFDPAEGAASEDVFCCPGYSSLKGPSAVAFSGDLAVIASYDTNRCACAIEATKERKKKKKKKKEGVSWSDKGPVHFVFSSFCFYLCIGSVLVINVTQAWLSGRSS